MAFECPNCKEETLSTRSAEVKICLTCGKILGWENVIELLEKMGIQAEVIDQVKNNITANL